MAEKIVSLESIAGGAAKELFEHELAAVLENIADINTPAKFKRSISLKVVFTPSERRDNAAVSVEVSKQLAKRLPAGSQVWFGVIRGERVAAEANPSQDDLFEPGKLTVIKREKESA